MAINESFLKKLRLLYVEDDDDMRQSMGKLLKRRLSDVRLAKDGQDGLDQYMAERPDLIVTDLEMPIMDGMEMIKRIRERDDGKDIPIIVVTAYKDSEHYTDEADAYIYKPMMVMELFSMITRIADR